MPRKEPLTKFPVSKLKEKMDKDLKERFSQLLGEEGLDSLLRVCISGLPTYLRVNTLRVSPRELMQELREINIITKQHNTFSFVLEVLSEEKKLGATLPFLHGEYFLQDLASIIAVLALEPQPGDLVFDCCAAPGGKTSFIYQVMKGEGTIVANDINKKRLVALSLNLTRMGVTNAIITNEDMLSPTEPVFHEEQFDRVLVDVPCTGEGLVSKFQQRLFRNTKQELHEFPLMQQKILHNAFKALKSGGTLVYSTCSTTIQENEEVLHRFLETHNNALLSTPEVKSQVKQVKIPILKERFPLIHDKVIRLFPHIHRTNGFFIAQVKKT